MFRILFVCLAIAGAIEWIRFQNQADTPTPEQLEVTKEMAIYLEKTPKVIEAFSSKIEPEKRNSPVTLPSNKPTSQSRDEPIEHFDFRLIPIQAGKALRLQLGENSFTQDLGKKIETDENGVNQESIRYYETLSHDDSDSLETGLDLLHRVCQIKCHTDIKSIFVSEAKNERFPVIKRRAVDLIIEHAKDKQEQQELLDQAGILTVEIPHNQDLNAPQIRETIEPGNQ
jgi:hypothetical protein